MSLMQFATEKIENFEIELLLVKLKYLKKITLRWRELTIKLGLIGMSKRTDESLMSLV